MKHSSYSNKDILSNGLKITIEFWGPESDEFKSIGAQASEEFSSFLLDKIRKEVPVLLSPMNFLGEAESYMISKGIPYSPKVREQYATAIYNDFIDALPKTVVYQKEDGMIYITPYVFSLEYGDFYRPALNFISTCINDWLVEVYKTSKKTINELS